MSQELVSVKPTPRRTRFHWGLRLAIAARPKSGRRRVWDRMASLERDLHATQDLNLRLTELLATVNRENEELRGQLQLAGETIVEKERQLRVAQEANVANAHTVDFVFAPRDISGPEDTATQPIPRVVISSHAVEPSTVLMPRVNLVEPVKVDLPPYTPADAMLMRVGAVPSPLTPAKTQLLPVVRKKINPSDIIIGASPMAGTDPAHTVPMSKVTHDG